MLNLRMRLLFPAATLLAAGTLWGATNLWDEEIHGTLNNYPFAPTNFEFVVHSIGTAADSINYVKGSILVIPSGANFFSADEDAFSFTVPVGRQLTGLFLTQTNTYTAYAWGGLYASTNGPWDGTGQIGDAWFAGNVPGTNDIFALLGVSSNLSSGPYSLAILPNPGVMSGSLLPGPDTIRYTLSIRTEAVPSLELRRVGDFVEISWATNGLFVLQSTPELTSESSWSSVTNDATIVSGHSVVAIPMGYGQEYFRLVSK